MSRRLRILCPVFNEAETLPGFLEYLSSLEPRDGISVEFLLVDAGSGDGSRDVLEGSSLVRTGRAGVVFGAPPVPSVGRTLNLGLRDLLDSDYFLVHPVDCRLPQESWRVLLDRIALSDHDVFAFEKAYDPQPPLLWLYSRALNSILLRILGRWVWTNLPCFRVSVFGRGDPTGIRFPERGFLEDLSCGSRLREQGSRVSVLPAQVQVSSRRYLRDGCVKRILLNGVITVLFFFGVRDYERVKKILYRS